MVELADGRIWMVFRTQTGYLFESYSQDQGETWSPARRTAFRSSNSPAALLRLDSGQLVMSWNNEGSYNPVHGVSYSRQALSMAIHDGSGWKGYRQVSPPVQATDDPGGTMTYSFLVKGSSGAVLVGYNDRRHVGERVHVRLFEVDPRWLLETDGRCLRTRSVGGGRGDTLFRRESLGRSGVSGLIDYFR